MNIEWYKQVLVTVIMMKNTRLRYTCNIIYKIVCYVLKRKFVKTANLGCSLIFSAFKSAND